MINNDLNLKYHSIEAGLLRNNIQDFQLKSLTISGPINGTDFLTIRDLKELTNLDLSDCKIVDGGL